MCILFTLGPYLIPSHTEQKLSVDGETFVRYLHPGGQLTLMAIDLQRREKKGGRICRNSAQKQRCSLDELRLKIHLAIVGRVFFFFQWMLCYF